MFALASVGGPLLGGFFTDSLSWRWIFYVNLPFGVAALTVTSVALRLPFRRLEHRIDYPGSVLLVAAVTAVVLATTWGGTTYPWGSAQIVGLAAAAAVLLGLFLAWEARASEPILPLRLFRNPIFTVPAPSPCCSGWRCSARSSTCPSTSRSSRAPRRSGRAWS